MATLMMILFWINFWWSLVPEQPQYSYVCSSVTISPMEPLMIYDADGRWHFSDQFMADLREATTSGTVWLDGSPELRASYPPEYRPSGAESYQWYPAAQLGLRPDGVVVWRRK
jgi:hypothetical protein